ETHLAGCSWCGAELAAFRRVRSALQEWELNDMPIVRVALPPRPRSAGAMLKELFGASPLWAKILSAGAAAMLILAVMGTDITIGQGGFHFGTRLLGIGSPVQQPPSPSVVQVAGSKKDVPALTAEEIKALVNKQIVDSERAQKEMMSRELARL